MVWIEVVCLFVTVLGVKGSSATFIQPCTSSDSGCLVSSAQAVVPFMAAGIPELNVQPLDPMTLDLVNGDGGGLELKFRDTVVTGMKDCVVEGLKLDPQKSRQHFTIRCTVELTGDYQLGGRLIILPIQGNGKYKINIRDIVIKSHTDIVPVEGADGKPHWHIARFRHSFDVKTNTHFEFDNLFNGNKVLADPVLQFANSNWRDVMQEIAPPVVRAIVTRVVDAVEALYKAVPIDELSLGN